MNGDKPLLVVDYNVGMKGVNVGGQMASYYLRTHWFNVWYRKVLLTDMAIIYALSYENGPTPLGTTLQHQLQ